MLGRVDQARLDASTMSRQVPQLRVFQEIAVEKLSDGGGSGEVGQQDVVCTDFGGNRTGIDSAAGSWAPSCSVNRTGPDVDNCTGLSAPYTIRPGS